MKGYLSLPLKLLKSEFGFFSILFLFVLIIFRKALSIYYFQDDFFFLKISKITSINDFINFFSPFKSYPYRPLATEVFYNILHVFKENVLVGHAIVFVVFFIGLYYLYKSLLLLTKNKNVAKLSVLLYASHLSHVFQLYWFATFQEILMFTSLTISFYAFKTNKNFLSIGFFIIALLSKETSVFFSILLLIIGIIYEKKNINIKRLIPFFIISIIFYLIYRYSLGQVTSLDNYRIEPNLSVLLNNAAWHFLWALGFANSLPGYVESVLLKPLPIFWDLFKIQEFKYYFILLITNLGILIIGTLKLILVNKNYNKFILTGIISLICFYLFLGPILLFTHKWMVRLTLPLIFISVFEGFWIAKLLKDKLIFKILGLAFLITYVGFNLFGIRFHESSGLFLLENKIYLNSQALFNEKKDDILKHKFIYFSDEIKYKTDIFKTSKMIEQTFADQSFIDHFFPGSNIIAIYEYSNKTIPKDAYVIKSIDILKTD